MLDKVREQFLASMAEAMQAPQDSSGADPFILDRVLCQEIEDFRQRDRRSGCDCEIPSVLRKYHGALGVGTEIRLCCIAKALEKLAGVPEGTFFLALEFAPEWDWDCEADMHYSAGRNPDGTAIWATKKTGKPPNWLLKRLKEKKRPIHNLKGS